MYSSCDATDKWAWTRNGSLKFKNKYCLKPVRGWSNPQNNVNLVLDSVCDRSQNLFKFVPSKYIATLPTVTSNVNRVCQRSAESREFSPRVSSHKEVDRVGRINTDREVKS